MKAKIYVGAKKYALYIGRKIVEKTLEFLTLPARFVSKKVQELKNLTMLGNSKQGVLPDGYTQLEYLETTGTQYIDTGIKPSVAYTWFKGKIVSTAINLGLGCRDAGGNTSNGTNSLFNYSNQVGTARLDWVDNTTAPARVLGDSTGVYDIKYLGCGKYDINGHSETIVPAVPAQTSRKSYSFYIGATNQDGTLRFVVPQKIYPCSLYYNDGSGDILEFDGIPARRNSDGVLGMYDLVTGQLFPNAGTGTFIAGDVAPTPTAPIEVESVGDKTKNLLPPDLLSKKTASGITLTPEGYGYRLSGEYSEYTQFVSTVDIPLEAGLYTLSGEGFLQLRSTTGATTFATKTINQNSIEFTLNEDTIVRFRIVVSTALELTTDLILPMLVKGSTAYPFEPYGYKVPVVVGGKNLFDKVNAPVGGYIKANGSFDVGASAKHIEFLEIPQGITKVSRFTKDWVTSEYNYVTRVGFYDKNKTTISVDYGFGSGVYITTSIPSNAKYIQCSIANKDVDGTVIYWGDEQISDYVPYSSTTTNIYLPEPLRKIGTFADTMSIEGNEVTVVRNVKAVDFKDLTFGGYDTQYRRYLIRGISNKSTVSAIRTGEGLSTTFTIWNSGGTAGSVSNNSFYWDVGTGGVQLFIVEDVVKDPTLLKEKLTGQYIYYSIQTPTTETYTIENPINLPQGTLTIDTDTNIKPSKINITGDIDNE